MIDHISFFALLLAFFIGPVPAIFFESGPNMHIPGLPPPIPKAFLQQEPCTTEEVFGKELDLIIYGASGITGKLAAQYLAKGHREHPRWAIAGRARKTVEDVYWGDLGSNTSTPKQHWNARLDKPTSLLEMTKRARVILNFAGPFEANGCENLIRAALEGCAHYVDVSEETIWNAQMFQKYESTAKARGLAIVQSAGFAALASDLLAMSAFKDALSTKKEMPVDVAVAWTKFNDGVSGTQMLSINNSFLVHGPVKDPYILIPSAMEEQRQDTTVDGNTHKYDFVPFLGLTLKKWSNAQIACPVVRRSLVMMYPKATTHVQEAATSDLLPERRRFLEDPAMTNRLGPVPKFPGVGQGPPQWVHRNGSFAGLAIASTTNGQRTVGIEGFVGPSFAATARMATELALGLSFQGTISGVGGYFTPTTALGVEELENRLNLVDNGEFVKIKHGPEKTFGKNI